MLSNFYFIKAILTFLYYVANFAEIWGRHYKVIIAANVLEKIKYFVTISNFLREKQILFEDTGWSNMIFKENFCLFTYIVNNSNSNS